MTTPAQEAKEYAAQHGFKIVANGRRYDVWTDYEGDEHQNHIAEVGGYPAALNAMKRYVSDAVKLGEAIGKDQLQQCADRFGVDRAVIEHVVEAEASLLPPVSDEMIRTLNRWIAVKTDGPLTPAEEAAYHSTISAPNDEAITRARQRRTGYYVRVTGPHGFVVDIPCANMKEAYRSCAQTANWFKRNGLTPVTKRSVIFKRG